MKHQENRPSGLVPFQKLTNTGFELVFINLERLPELVMLLTKNQQSIDAVVR